MFKLNLQAVPLEWHEYPLTESYHAETCTSVGDSAYCIVNNQLMRYDMNDDTWACGATPARSTQLHHDAFAVNGRSGLYLVGQSLHHYQPFIDKWTKYSLSEVCMFINTKYVHYI